MRKIRTIFGHWIFTRYVWFYLALVLTALIAFWGGIKYAKTTQPAGDTLRTLFETDVPPWLKSIQKNGKAKSLGDPEAPVKVVEYMDIECPYCQQYSAKVFPKIVKEYVKARKVYYVTKHFPLSRRVHPHATMGAVAAECAANQSKFWKFKTLAVSNRRYQSKSLFLALANIANIPNREKFTSCFKQKRTLGVVREEKQQGIQRKVKGTPTVFVNGTAIRGVRPYSVYAQAIETALNSRS